MFLLFLPFICLRLRKVRKPPPSLCPTRISEVHRIPSLTPYLVGVCTVHSIICTASPSPQNSPPKAFPNALHQRAPAKTKFSPLCRMPSFEKQFILSLDIRCVLESTRVIVSGPSFIFLILFVQIQRENAISL